MTILETHQVKQSFDKKEILHGIDVSFEAGKIYSIVGPNGCGKSTLLDILSASKKPSQGQVLLKGQDIFAMSRRQVARQLALMVQMLPKVDATVEQLVSYGRHPHKGFLQRLNKEDDQIIDRSLALTHLQGYRDRYLDTLSGGERQRAWLAMALAQETDLLLLDEPTTYLDISHQLDLLNLVQELNQKLGMTIIVVLHDLNQAIQYSDEIIVMQSGRLVRQGPSQTAIDQDILRDVFKVGGERLVNSKGQYQLHLTEVYH